MSTRAPRFARVGLYCSAAAALGLVSFAGCSSDDPARADADAGQPDVVLAEASKNEASVTKEAGGPDAQPMPQGLPIGPRDRAGKPYVSLVLVSAANREDYNLEPVDMALTTDPVHDGGTTFGQDFQSTLVMLDGLDGTKEWNGGLADAGPDDAGAFPHPITNAWIGVDALLVDPNKPFSDSGFLDLEANPASHATCGGRWFGDDALDKTMSFLVKKSLVGVSDGVSAPAKPVSMTFPYLATPF